jgi:hypothetical protein
MPVDNIAKRAKYLHSSAAENERREDFAGEI